MDRNPLTPQVPAAFMANLTSALDQANGMLRLSGLSVRIRERRHSQWLSVYQVLPGGGTRERTMRGNAAADPEAVGRLPCGFSTGSGARKANAARHSFSTGPRLNAPPPTIATTSARITMAMMSSSTALGESPPRRPNQLTLMTESDPISGQSS